MTHEPRDLTALESHFGFGANWIDYAGRITPKRMAAAMESLRRLTDREDLQGLSVLDLGSGSGLLSAALLGLGCRRLLAVDIDPDSVAATQRVLEGFAPAGSEWEVRQVSVFDLPQTVSERFDLIYS